jgi:hypothetical protein
MKPDPWKIRSVLGIAERKRGDEQNGRSDLEAAFPNVDEEKLKITVGRELIESYALLMISIRLRRQSVPC